MKTKPAHPSVAEFAERIHEFLAEMRERDMPMVLSVDGEPAVVVYDLRLAEYLGRCQDRELKELLVSRVKAIDSGESQGTPAEEVFKELRSRAAGRNGGRGKTRR